jgi:cytochrome c2
MKPRTKRVCFVTGALVAIAAAALVATLAERERSNFRERAGFLLGNPRTGGKLFYDRGCGHCHAVSGIGGDKAVDFARTARAAPADLAEIAGEMWNHAPDMFEEMTASGFAPSELTPRDFADIMAFLFIAGYLEEAGDPARGEEVLVKERCRSCHTTGEIAQKAGPDLASWSSKVNPILWAQRLWNHAPTMEAAMEEQDIAWPQLSRGEVLDLLSYLRRVGTAPRDPVPLPGDPWAGRNLFRLHCQSCHQAEGEGGDTGPDLGTASSLHTLSGLAAALWNHSPAMGERMKELGVNRPTFTEQEMADLITYLFALRYFESPGDAGAGSEVYKAKCSRCHGENGAGGDGGPSLHSLGRGFGATFIASTLWNHGPRMYQAMREQGVEWPRFQVMEMRNLIAYLRSLS